MKTYPAYKPSRLSWLKQIPESWGEKRARFLFRVIDERSETGNEELLSVSHITGVTPRSEKNITMFMAESYEGHKLCQPGDLVINSMWAWMAALGVSRHYGIISSAYHVYRQHDARTLNTKFLDYLLRTKGYAGEYLCRSKGVWSSRLLLLPFAFFDIPILVPARQEQDAIVAFLEAKEREIETFIRHKRRTIELLKEQKAALINRAVTRGLNPAAPLKPSGIDWLGDIPAHWMPAKLSWICTSIRDGTHAPPTEAEGIYRLLSVRNIVNGELVLRDDDRTMAEKSYNELQRSYTVRENDVVLAIVGGTTGKSAVVGKLENISVQRSLAILRPNKLRIHPQFLNVCLQLPMIQRKIWDTAEKYAAQPGIYLVDVAKLRVPLPPLDEQTELLKKCDEINNSISHTARTTEREIALIEEYRASLIDAAVTGKIDCRNAPEASRARASVTAAD